MADGRKTAPLDEPIPNTAIVSYPKSGRTWLRVMLDNLGVRLRYTHNHSQYHLGIKDRRPHSDKSEFAGQNVCLLVRHPLDTLVSAWHHCRTRDATYTGSLDGFLKHERYGLQAWVGFHRNWHEAMPTYNFTVVSYEQLHADTRGQVLRLANFFGHPPESFPERLIKDALARGSFETMHKFESTDWRRRPKWFRNYGRMLLPIDFKEKDSYKTRRGVVGGWGDYLNAREKERWATAVNKISTPYWKPEVW